MYAWLCFLFLVLLWFACQWLDGFLNDSSNCMPFNSIWHKSTCRLNLNFILGRMWWLLPMGIHWGPSSCTLTN
jgi:glycopeptide antibiotics resistance protein